MSKAFPDCPIWMRITDQESKPPTGVVHHYNQQEHEWTDEEKMLLVRMKAAGKSNREVAAAVSGDISSNACNSMYHRMEELGELDRYERPLKAF